MLRKTILMFALLMLIAFLSGCLKFEKMELIVSIKKQGAAKVEYNIYDIGSTEKGEKAKKEIQSLFKDVKNKKFTNDFVKFGLKNIKTTLVYSKTGKLNGRIRGETNSVLVLVKLLLPGNNEILAGDKEFLIQWKNSILTIKAKTSKVIERKSKKPTTVIIVKTEGVFLAGTTGKISVDKKETRFSDNKNMVLIIDGLLDKKLSRPSTISNKNKSASQARASVKL